MSEHEAVLRALRAAIKELEQGNPEPLTVMHGFAFSTAVLWQMTCGDNWRAELVAMLDDPGIENRIAATVAELSGSAH